jgi:hypothetical protein
MNIKTGIHKRPVIIKEKVLEGNGKIKETKK